MNDDDATPPAIDSRAGFVAALRWGFHTAVAQRARRIVCCDADFADWPLDDPELLQALTGWLRLPQRRLALLAARYDDVPRRQPRFADWRRYWAHAIDAWQPPAEQAGDLPTLLVADGGISVQLIDARHWRGRAALDAASGSLWLDKIDAVLQRSEPAFAVRMLGL